MWVYKLRFRSDGSLEKHKAWLVVKGYAQAEGLNYDETFASTMCMIAIRRVIAMAAHYKWLIFQMDVKSMFLNGDLDEEVHVDQLAGFVVPMAANKVCQLKRAPYGLKQAPKAWYHKINSFLSRIQLMSRPSDSNLVFSSERVR